MKLSSLFAVTFITVTSGTYVHTSGHRSYGRGAESAVYGLGAPLPQGSGVRGLGCGDATCGVTIPNFRAYPSLTAPVFQKFGLIEVQAPHRPYITSVPSVVAQIPKFAVAAPNRGKVVEKTEPSYFCKKPGFVLEGVDCVQTLFENPRLVCPGGFESLTEGGCLRRSSILQTCPQGYIRRDGGCVKVLTQSFVDVCPEGSVETGDGLRKICQRQVAQPLIPTCDGEGFYDTRTGSCLVNSFAEARAYCPEGFNFDEAEGVCLQEEIYDCSNQALGVQTIPQLGITNVAPVGLSHIHHGLYGKAIKGRYLKPVDEEVEEGKITETEETHLEGKDETDPADKRILTHGLPLQLPLPLTRGIPTTLAQTVAAPCVQAIPQPCEVPCVAQRVAPPPCEPAPKVMVQPTKTTISVQKTCTRVTSTALVFDCDEGFLQGNRCLVKQSVPPVPVCRAQGGPDYCYALQRTPALKECPEGFVKECGVGRVCQCVAFETAAFATSCPSGFDMLGDGCQRAVTAQTVCPPGYVIQEDACVRVLREAADCVFSVTYECDRSVNSECA